MFFYSSFSKKFLSRLIFSAFLLALIFALYPSTASAQTGLVPCTGVKNEGGEIRCTVCHLYTGVRQIINFILTKLVLPLAVVAILAGGIYLLISAGNPGKIETGKSIIWWAIIGLILAFAAWVIINTILDTVGFKLPISGVGREWFNYELCGKSPIGGSTPFFEEGIGSESP